MASGDVNYDVVNNGNRNKYDGNFSDVQRLDIPDDKTPLHTPLPEDCFDDDGLGKPTLSGLQPSGLKSEEDKWTMIPACALNTLNMFGTGPFITIPFLIAATNPPGPQAMIGYALAAVCCVCDSFIWGELGSMFPHSGGTYVYLREAFGREKLGRPLSFLFVWQFLMSGPMEVASGFIAMSQYFSYILGFSSYAFTSLFALGWMLFCSYLIYRGLKDSMRVTVFIWIITIGAIIFTWFAGLANFNSNNLKTPSNAFNGSAFILSLGAAARFGIYDFTGYFDINYMGDDVKDPERTIPLSNVVTCSIVNCVYFITIISVIGYLPWNPEEGGFVSLVQDDSDSANFIMSIFSERLIGRGFAIFFTIIVIITIFGSCFALMLGYTTIAPAAAEDGYFFESFKTKNSNGVYTVSLAVVTIASAIFCFVDLEIVIEGMLTTRLLVQFMLQTIALVYLRKTQPNRRRPFKVPLYPLPCIIQFIIFGFVFITTPSYFSDDVPLLELGVIFLAAGLIIYCVWGAKNRMWPFAYDNACYKWFKEHPFSQCFFVRPFKSVSQNDERNKNAKSAL